MVCERGGGGGGGAWGQELAGPRDTRLTAGASIGTRSVDTLLLQQHKNSTTTLPPTLQLPLWYSASALTLPCFLLLPSQYPATCHHATVLVPSRYPTNNHMLPC